MPYIVTPTATTSASAIVAVNNVTRDGGVVEAMQLMNVADGVTGQTATVSASAMNVNTFNQTAVQAASGDPSYQAQGTPYNTLKISGEPSTLFYDGFDAGIIDTTNRWLIPSGAVSPSSSAGQLSVNPGTTAGAFSSLQSQYAFNLPANAYLVSVFVGTIDTTAVTGNYRFWGQGTAPTTPTTTTAITNGIGFEIDTTGSLNAVIYASGNNVFKAALTYPSSGQHRYAVYFKGSHSYWFIDNTNVYVAQASLIQPYVQTLPLSIINVNSSSSPNADIFQFSAVDLADTAHNNGTLSDGLYPWKRATVSSIGTFTPAASAASLATYLPITTGTWSYYAGTSGTINVTSGQRVLGITAHATNAGSTMTINGGQSFPIIANSAFNLTPNGNLTAPTIVFSGTDSYFIETIT
jgi:hypothetical protein